MKYSLALVTGASSGIGREVARVLANEGIDLIIHGRNGERLAALKKELQSLVKVETLIADLAESGGRQMMVDKIREAAPDLVINNAGMGHYGDVLKLSVERQLEIIKVNVDAAFEIAFESARSMVDHQKKGVILNVSSAGSFQMFPKAAVYGASKAFLTNFTESFDAEISRHGLRCLVSCPGVVNTRFSDRASGKQLGSIPYSMTAEFVAREIWKQIQKGKTVHVFDWRYRAAIFIARFLPASLLAKLIKGAMKSRL